MAYFLLHCKRSEGNLSCLIKKLKNQPQLQKKMITWNDFEKVDMRVGTVIKVGGFPEAKNPAYKLTIDFGELGIKKSSAQITKLYRKEDLINRQVIAVMNFPPKQIADFISEVLVLGVVLHNKEVVLIKPDNKAKNGLRIA